VAISALTGNAKSDSAGSAARFGLVARWSAGVKHCGKGLAFKALRRQWVGLSAWHAYCIQFSEGVVCLQIGESALTDQANSKPANGGSSPQPAVPQTRNGASAEPVAEPSPAAAAHKPRSRRKRNWGPFDGQSGAESPYLRKG
jgi:hypothetical protein